MSNLEKYKHELEELIKLGNRIRIALHLKCLYPDVKAENASEFGEEVKEIVKDVNRFSTLYERWYSEALAVVRLLLPDRAVDFIGHYERPKTRKELTPESYRIQDCLLGIQAVRTLTKETVVGPSSAIPHLDQQIAILEAVRGRFESSLFDLRHMLQADLFDSEIAAAEYLAKKKFHRAAGALAGVVLERHLGQVCSDHKIAIAKRHATIADFNEALKANQVIDVPQWRFVQHLGDLRNLCDHARDEPTAEQVEDLIAGIKKVTKTVF